MAPSYDQEQIRVALTETDESYTNYLDLQTGSVVRVHSSDEDTLNAILAEFGDRYRYIPGGNTSAGDTDVQTWLEAEGL